MIVIHFDAPAVYAELRNSWMFGFDAADVSPFENLIARTKAVRRLADTLQRNHSLHHAMAAALNENWHRPLQAIFP